MKQSESAVTTVHVGQRGRIFLPAQVQRAVGVGEGTAVTIRVTPEGTVTIEPLWAVRARLKATYSPLLAGHLPVGKPRLHVGGGAGGAPADGLGPLRQLPDAGPGSGRLVYQDDTRIVFTARAVLGWLASDSGDVVETALPHAVMPEAAVADLITVLAQAGAHDRADVFLAELAVVGVRQPYQVQHHAQRAQDTVVALGLVDAAAQAGQTLTLSDALCAAAAVRLKSRLLAADLLATPSGAPDDPIADAETAVPVRADAGAARGRLLPAEDAPSWQEVPAHLRRKLVVPARELVTPPRGLLKTPEHRRTLAAVRAAARAALAGKHWLVLLTTPRSVFGGPRSGRANRLYATLEQIVAEHPALADD